MQKPVMIPPAGERILRFVGDTVRFTLRQSDHSAIPGGRALLRTNLGKAATLRKEIISTYSGKRPLSVAFWRDIPMQRESEDTWSINMPITEPGYFKAKAYVVDPLGRQNWPDGPDVGLCCHPNSYRSGNTIYCAFTRMFGETKAARSTRNEALEKKMRELDERGFAVIPPSGKLRDLTRELPHIMGTLNCKILHLLPINPTPTTFARFGRFGSPYACEDLTTIDPALVEFDKKTNGEDQFRELAYAVHQRGGRVFLDVVINHTGWGSTLFETHPEWFLREQDGTFISPGAWGNIWADLVELNPNFTELWEHLAEAFLTWCRRGVDGFRCDAGYKVPLPVWQYIEARVRQEFPETVLLLEGLGGSWEATETLLTDGGMQWAYSELFQNYSGAEVQWYLDYALRQSERVGVYVHYSETHDNDRLAKKGKEWSLLRNRLCGLTSVCGGFGFSCGVEWLADEKIEVHQSRGMSWDSKENIVPELTALNDLLTNHPCFFDGAKLTRISQNASPVFAIQRISGEGLDAVLVLINTDMEAAHDFSFAESVFKELGEPHIDLLGQPDIKPAQENGRIVFRLPAGSAYCLGATKRPRGLHGNEYRRRKGVAAWAMTVLSKVLMPEEIGPIDWQELAQEVDADVVKFLGAVSNLASIANATVSPEQSTNIQNLRITTRREDGESLLARMKEAESEFPQVVSWTLLEARRITCIPPRHWLLIRDSMPFRATVVIVGEERHRHAESIQVGKEYVAAFAPRDSIQTLADGRVLMERYGVTEEKAVGHLRFLTNAPSFAPAILQNEQIADDAMVLLTNGTGGMARLCVDVGRIKSKYDCALGANLHPGLPVDRHVFVKRLRIWINAGGFITPLNLQNLASFEVGPPAVWRFLANAGDERLVEVEMTADMLEGRNTTVFLFGPGAARSVAGTEMSKQNAKSGRGIEVRLIVRVDIEDRNFHTETHRSGGADHHFGTNCRPLETKAGFVFAPGHERELRVFSDSGFYHHQSEWCEKIEHPVEQSRGQIGSGDAYSPGWFDLPLRSGGTIALILTADATDPSRDVMEEALQMRRTENNRAGERVGFADSFGAQLAKAARQFVVRRGSGKTVIAGYPWFLDWGRDTMIAARGLLAAGLRADVLELLMTYGRFVEHGTMPNTIHGDNASNRDTSDAPLWYAVVCEEAARDAQEIYSLTVDGKGRTIADVLREIAVGYLRGTPNGIHVDVASGLVWSPSHFTWMDTNYPAGTPREGYPIEIQVLWIRLLRQLQNIGIAADLEPWIKLAQRAEKSLQQLFWLEKRGYFADLLIAAKNQGAADAVVDDALRSNYLFAVSLGLITGEQARRCVVAALQYLVVPGALRSLAPLLVSTPLRIERHGRLLNDPEIPYCGHYRGDEDTQRKPAYHNGTAWTWTFPSFCEALVKAWNFSPSATMAARAYLASMEKEMKDTCLGQIPEIIDGDYPHFQRGCDAQAWSITEALRVWKLLGAIE